MDETFLEKARVIARQSHAGHLDQSGIVYAEHAFAVAERAKILAVAAGIFSPEQVIDAEIVALFHDIVEENEHTDIAPGDLEREGFTAPIVSRVLRLSSRGHLTYQENIDRMIAENDLIVILTKAADNEHNLTPERIETLPPEKQSIARRYRKSLRKLAAAYERITGQRYPLPLGRALLDEAA